MDWYTLVAVHRRRSEAAPAARQAARKVPAATRRVSRPGIFDLGEILDDQTHHHTKMLLQRISRRAGAFKSLAESTVCPSQIACFLPQSLTSFLSQELLKPHGSNGDFSTMYLLFHTTMFSARGVFQVCLVQRVTILRGHST